MLVVDASEEELGAGLSNFQPVSPMTLSSSSNYNVGMSTLTNVNDWEAVADEGVPRDRQAPQDRLLSHPAGALPDLLLRRREPGLRQDQRRVFLKRGRRPGSAIWTPSSFTSVILAVGWNRQPWKPLLLGLEGKTAA